MRNLYLTLSFLVVNISLFAQIVSIPDTNFKNKLISLGVDSNNDGSIQKSEALAVVDLDISNSSISSVSGIESFKNLLRLNCNNNSLTSLNLNELELQELRCNHNQLTQLNAISYETKILDVSYNQLTELILPTGVNYSFLNISGNLYTNVNFNDVKLKYFYCEDTKLTELNFSSVRQLSETISIQNNPDLVGINFKNGKFDLCYVIYGGCHLYLVIANNPNLTNICADEFDYEGPTTVTETEYFQSYYNLPNISYNTNCTSNTDRVLKTEILTLKENYKIYPNPVQDILNIDTENTIAITNINIYNTLGQLVKKIVKPEMSLPISITVSDLKRGSYIVEVISNKGKTSKKLLKL